MNTKAEGSRLKAEVATNAPHELAEIIRMQRENDLVRAASALAALPLLIEACSHKTGQSYHLRSLLYSLWNGQPASLLDVVHLDRSLRDALLSVVSAFGSDVFFYNEVSGAFKSAGLFDWFIEEGPHE